MRDLLQTDPNQHGAADMIADTTRPTTLATIDARQLLVFTMELLNLGSPAPHVLCGRRPILSDLVRDEVVRAPGRERQTEQFHLMTGWEVSQMHQPSRA